MSIVDAMQMQTQHNHIKFPALFEFQHLHGKLLKQKYTHIQHFDLHSFFRIFKLLQ